MTMNFSKQIIVCVIFVFIQTIAARDNEWTCRNRKCYTLVRNHQGAYSDSDRYCGQLRGRAVTIYSQDEQKFLENYLRNIRYGKSVWIGGIRENTKFAWRNDEVLIEGDTYANWASEHPTMNFAKACMQMNGMNQTEPGKWVENFCFASNGILCERFEKDDNNNDNDNDDDDDDDDDDRENDHNNNNNNNNNQCCKRLESEMKKMRENMEKKFKKMDKMNDRMDDMNDQMKKISEQMKEFSDKIKRFEHSMESLNVKDIERNFTGIASVLEYYSEQLHTIRNELDNRPTTDVDLNIIKREIIDYFQQQLEEKNLNDIVNDIKLSYVNFRRALMVKKGGRWSTLGYV